MVECLPRMYKIWITILGPYKPDVVAHICNPRNWKMGTRELKIKNFKIFLGYLWSLSLFWDVQNFVSKRKIKKKRKTK